MPTVRTVLASVLLAAAWAKPSLSLGHADSEQHQGHPMADKLEQRQDSQEYWLAELGKSGKAPLAGAGYSLFRNIRDFGAKGDGQSDDSEAINRAVAEGDRCGQNCSSTFVKSAVIYFPPGEYKICSPIIQFYHTQFVGHPVDRPTIKGCDDFKGIALIDANPYMAGGVNWWVNQNQFFRQIRNFVLDMTDMPNDTRIQDDLAIVPTGIHWQVSQAATLQNILFKMPQRAEGVKHVGVIMENGSGGFVADLTFEGGDVGFRAGSQQYTARGLQFKGMRVAVDMLWDWGFNWQAISIEDTDVGFNRVKAGVMTASDPATAPNIVIDNMFTEDVDAVIKNTNDETVLDARNEQIGPYTIGRRYLNGKGEYKTGYLADDPARKIPVRPNGLLQNFDFYTRSRPQYGSLNRDDIRSATDHGVSNDGTGDQTEAINRFLADAAKDEKLAFFPAGIYQIHGTVHFPKGSRIQGSSWSQIQGTGSYFGDAENPKVMVRVGDPDESGSMEISDMLFTVKGPTAGAILMEWNILADQQGSAGMWDSHFRVGGATGSDLDMAACPKGSQDYQKCMAASLLFHLKPHASGYFENVWLWTADHDNDANIFGQPTSTSTQINVYVGRGALIESTNPSWFYGGGSEHNTLYQYQLVGAENVFMGHIQTETPYYQPNPVATVPYRPGKFPGDPTFEDCHDDDIPCREAWGLRIINSTNVYMHSVGLYQFFSNYAQDCIPGAACQRRLLEVARAFGNGSIYQNETQRGFTTEVAVWVPPDGQETPEIIYLSPEIYGPDSNTASCDGFCQFVLPPSTLPRPTTFTLPDYTTSLKVSTETITITVPIPPITTDKIHFSNVNVTSGQTPGQSFLPLPSIDIPEQTTVLTGKDGQLVTRTLVLPPFPAITQGPPVEWGTKYPDVWSFKGNSSTSSTSRDTSLYPLPPPFTRTWPDDEPWPGEIKTSCKAWFFSICISFPKVNFSIKSIRFNFPKGPRLIGPGPPPGLKTNLPPGFKFEGPPINFPQFSMQNGKPVFPTEPPGGCQTKEASICYYSTSYGVTEDATTTRTTATSVAPPECQTVYGCEVKDWETTATDTSIEQCERPTVVPRVPRRADLDRLYGCETAGRNYIIYPSEFSGISVIRIRQQLERRRQVNGIQFYEVRSSLGLDPDRAVVTIFFHVDLLDASVLRAWEDFLDGDMGYYYSYPVGVNTQAPTRRDTESEDLGEFPNGNVTFAVQESHTSLPTRARRDRLSKRVVASMEDYILDRALVSLPEGEDWDDDQDRYTLVDSNGEDIYRYWSDHDGSFNDQFIYIMESSEPSSLHDTHPEFGSDIPGTAGKQRPRTEIINIPHTWGPAYQSSVSSRLHTDQVISKATGTRLGLVPQVHTIVVPFHGITNVGQTVQSQPFERFLEGLLRIAESVHTYGHHRRAVVNMSWVARAASLANFQVRALNYLLRILDSQHVVLVAAAGNEAQEAGRQGIDSYPALFADPNHPDGGYIANLIAVGATDELSSRAEFSQDADWITAYAYAKDVNVFDYDQPDGYTNHPGATSFAAPIVSGLVSYLRAIDHRWRAGLQEPVNVKRLIEHLAKFKTPVPGEVATDPRRIVWNGEYAYIPDVDMVGESSNKKRQQNQDIRVISCLRDYDKWPSDAPPRDSICPQLPDDLSQLLPRSPIPDNIIPAPKPVRFTTVEPGVPAGPTCTGDCERGHTCSGYYCNPHPNPTESPPDFSDPPAEPTEVTLTNLPTLSSAQPTPTRPPKPSPKEKAIAIMRENTLDGTGSAFDIFAGLGDPCDMEPVSEQAFGTWTAMEPPNLTERFDAHGYKGIWYERSEGDQPGVLHVPGRWGEQDGPVKCQWDAERGKRHKCPLFIDYWRQIVCVWDD
ncbi:glucan 1,3-beta-glucosidase [Naviculisporaceae sp. PSN 640]